MTDRIGLKVACMAIVLCMVTVPFGMSLNAESTDDYDIIDDDMEACYTTTETTDYRNSKVNASLAVGTWNGYWIEARDSWEYNFKIGGMGVSGIDCIDGASMKVEGPQSYSEIRLSDMEAYIGCAPRSEEFEADMMDGISQLIVDILLALVPVEDAFEDIWTVASDVLSLLGAGCDHMDDDKLNYFNYSWEWTSPIAETVQQVWIVADLDPNVTQSFEVEYTLSGDFGSITTSALRMTITSPTTAGDPSSLTPAERESAGIMTVQREDIITYATELNLTSEDVIQLLSTDEQEFYFATSVPTCELITTSDDGIRDVQPVTDILETGIIPDVRSPDVVDSFETYQTGSAISSFRHSVLMVSNNP